MVLIVSFEIKITKYCQPRQELLIQSVPIICMASGTMLRYAISQLMHYDSVRVIACFLM